MDHLANRIGAGVRRARIDLVGRFQCTAQCFDRSIFVAGTILSDRNTTERDDPVAFLRYRGSGFNASSSRPSRRYAFAVANMIGG